MNSDEQNMAQLASELLAIGLWVDSQGPRVSKRHPNAKINVMRVARPKLRDSSTENTSDAEYEEPRLHVFVNSGQWTVLRQLGYGGPVDGDFSEDFEMRQQVLDFLIEYLLLDEQGRSDSN